MSDEEISRLKVKDLKQFLRERGEQVSGSKQELINRVKGVKSLNKLPLSEIQQNDQRLDNQRLLDKLVTPLGEKLPTPEILKNWKNDVTVIPSVTDDILYNFLVLNSNRTTDAKQTNARKQLKAKVFYEDRHVHSIAYSDIFDDCSHCFVRCKVVPSLPTDSALKKPDYTVWICLSKVTGRVHSASCTCTAGKGESCNHIAALLYALVDITTKKEDGTLSSTSQLCKWNQPRKRKLSPKKAQDILFRKQGFGKAKKDEVEAAAKDKKIDINGKVKAIDKDNFASKLANVNPNAAWLKTVKQDIHEKKSEDDIVPSIHNINLQIKDSVDLNDATQVPVCFTKYFEDLSMTEEQCRLIEKKTRGQSVNNLWRMARAERITSSNFGPICKRLDKTSPENMVKRLLYATSFETEATKWGKTHEPAARRMYKNIAEKEHSNFSIFQTGLVVRSRWPHLGTSPDGYVMCSCEDCEQNEGLLEIKCPFKYRNLTPQECAANGDFCCYLDADAEGHLQLKTDHDYYYQIQGQMAICLRPWCDFVIWTLKGISVTRIDFDYILWETKLLAKLNNFYVKGVIPELFTSRVKRGKSLY